MKRPPAVRHQQRAYHAGESRTLFAPDHARRRKALRVRLDRLTRRYAS